MYSVQRIYTQCKKWSQRFLFFVTLLRNQILLQKNLLSLKIWIYGKYSDFFWTWKNIDCLKTNQNKDIPVLQPKRIEYTLEWNLENPSVWILSVPERESTNHKNVHKLYPVEYINTVCSLDYPFQFWIF